MAAGALGARLAGAVGAGLDGLGDGADSLDPIGDGDLVCRCDCLLPRRIDKPAATGEDAVYFVTQCSVSVSRTRQRRLRCPSLARPANKECCHGFGWSAFVKVTFACPVCDQPATTPIDHPLDWQCC